MCAGPKSSLKKTSQLHVPLQFPTKPSTSPHTTFKTQSSAIPSVISKWLFVPLIPIFQPELKSKDLEQGFFWATPALLQCLACTCSSSLQALGYLQGWWTQGPKMILSLPVSVEQGGCCQETVKVSRAPTWGKKFSALERGRDGREIGYTPFPVSLGWVLSSGAGPLAQTPGVIWLHGHLQLSGEHSTKSLCWRMRPGHSFPFRNPHHFHILHVGLKPNTVSTKLHWI